jgi:hypothetical protein
MFSVVAGLLPAVGSLSNAALVLGALTLCCLSTASGARAAEKPPIPDFTQGGKKDANHDWTLGPTGVRGWIFGSKGQTADARQILVTTVDAGSPADGVLRVNDVILGMDGKPFAGDARILLARALTVAEEKSGELRLIRWREGKSENVGLKLAVLGKYSNTAPYDCPKSKKIFEQGCRLIAKNGLNNADIPIHLNALALLASGNKEYHPMLAEYAKKVAASLRPGTWTWYYGYGNIFLAEYVLATGDQAILAELKRTTKEAIVGQSSVGTWGHEYATKPSGNLNGYGCMNLPGLLQTTGLVLARQAGVKDPALDQAIGKSARFLRYYVNKGAFPYGDHQPWPGHEDNGKCSLGAVLFDLLGDSEAAAFFARMSTAAYEERERGHTGNFFNVQWALPGVSRCGPLATGTYLKEEAWYYDLARNWQGGFGYQGSPVGEEEYNQYTEWDCTGAYLLAYALPLKSLYLTGKKPCSVEPLNAKEVSDVIAAGRDYLSPTGRHGVTYDGRTTEQLLAGLSSWSPAVRKRSAQTLGKREGDFVPQLLKLLASPDRYARYGACEALGNLESRADAAASQLRALLKDPDPWLRSLACNALPRLGPEARKASQNDLMALLACKNADDPRGMTHRAVSIALFSPYPGSNTPTIFNNSLEGVDRKLLYPAIRSLLENDDSVARGGPGVIYGVLSDRDLAELLPAIIKAAPDQAPTNEMFADAPRLPAFDLLSKHHIREGLSMMENALNGDRIGGDVIPTCLGYLLRYGVHAKEVLPRLKPLEMIRKRWGPQVEAIEKSTESPPLVSLQEFIEKAAASNKTTEIE